MIQRTDSKEYILIDMGSRNSSFVNERRLSTPIQLRDGDRLTLGNAQMTFRNPHETGEDAALQQEDDSATALHLMQCLVSVLVIDIRGFTVMSQHVEDAVLCQVTGTWFGEADRIMRNHGSAAEKYIGDAVMAVWLHRVKGQEHLEILEILRAVREFADITASLSARFGLTDSLQIGAGLNTGLATVGNIGATRVTDYTATGECVNAAFRLESATKGLQTDICLGKTTADFLRYWPRADAYLQEKDVVLKGYNAGANLSGYVRVSESISRSAGQRGHHGRLTAIVLKMLCPNCHAEASATATSCPRCGTSLSGEQLVRRARRCSNHRRSRHSQSHSGGGNQSAAPHDDQRGFPICPASCGGSFAPARAGRRFRPALPHRIPHRRGRNGQGLQGLR
jgi:adenylate cyclase